MNITSSGTTTVPCQHLFELTCELKVGETPSDETSLAIIGEFKCVTCGVRLYPLKNGKPTEGITVPLTTKAPEPKTKVRPQPDPAKGLPGTEMLLLTQELGIVSPPNCGCKAMAEQMDIWGVDGCRDNMQDLNKAINSNWQRWGWQDKLKAVNAAKWKAVGLGINPLHPIRDLLVLAIERADQKRPQGGEA